MIYGRFLKLLNARGMFRIHPSLGRVSKVLAVLGNPQDQWPSIHIAGTNGKGSVAAALESVLRANGYRTGLYTSPHLIDLRERVQVDGIPFVDGFTSVAQEVLQAEKRAKAPLTYFELLTAIAFQTFAKKKVDIGIIECGMGGQWDATNVLKQPLVSLMTSIGLEHTAWLGKTESEIAAQKAGIIKSGGYVISGIRGRVGTLIERLARKKRAQLAQIDHDFHAQALTTSWPLGRQTLRYTYKHQAPQTISFGLLGRHQTDNAGLVMTALRRLSRLGWSIRPMQRDEGLRHVRWPGRMQLIRNPKKAPLLLDGAHNPHAMAQLLKTIDSSPFKNVPKMFIFSAFMDKDYNQMAVMLARLRAPVLLCPLGGSRGATLAQLRLAFRKAGVPAQVFESPAQALSHAMANTSKQGLVVATGSLALVGQLLKIIQSEPSARRTVTEEAPCLL